MRALSLHTLRPQRGLKPEQDQRGRSAVPHYPEAPKLREAKGKTMKMCFQIAKQFVDRNWTLSSSSTPRGARPLIPPCVHHNCRKANFSPLIAVLVKVFPACPRHAFPLFSHCCLLRFLRRAQPAANGWFVSLCARCGLTNLYPCHPAKLHIPLVQALQLHREKYLGLGPVQTYIFCLFCLLFCGCDRNSF